MPKKLIARTAKLLTESRRGHRDKGVAVTYEHIPRDVDERNHGSIYAVINVNAPTGEAEEITELITDAFHGEYYQDLNRDPLTSFETALSKVNEELGEATHAGNTSWLKNLNAILAVLSETTLHITKAGSAEAYLYRGDKSSHISDDLAGDTVNPLRTFINIASGDLLEGDKIAIASPSVFFHISKDELQKYVQEFQPRVAISHLADLLEGTSNEINPNAILILEAITPEAASNETIEEQPDEVWISEPKKPIKSVTDASAPFLKKVWLVLVASWLGIVALVQEQIIPLFKTVFSKAGNVIQGFGGPGAKAKPKGKEKILVETDESISPTKENLDDLTVDESEEAETEGAKSELAKKSTGQEIYIKESSHKPKWLKLEKVNFSVVQNIFSKFKKSSHKLAAKRNNVLIIAIVIILLLGGGIFLTWKNKENQEQKKTAKISLTEAQSKYEAGQGALASGQKKSAADILREAQKIAESLSKNKYVDKEAKPLLERINLSLDQAEAVVRLNPEVFADAQKIAGNKPLGPYLVGNSLYLINQSNGSIASISTKSGEVSNVLDDPTINEKILASTVVLKRSVLVILTDKGTIYEFDTKEAKLNKEDVFGDIEKAVAMTSFSTNIYTLDNVNGKIYKRLKTSTGYGKRIEYITDGSTVKGEVGLASDSSIYVLKKNGEIIKYLAGRKQNFTLSDLPFNLERPTTIFANENLKDIYVTDPSKNRVVIFDDKGKFINQQISSKFNNLSGLFVSGKTGYISANGKVYKISL
jgi:hypothetical protein